MIDAQQFCQLKDLYGRQGLQAVQSAPTLGLDPRTVVYWWRPARFRPRKAPPRTSKRAPFKTQIVQMLETYPSSAAQGLQRLRAQGFDGGDSIVNAYGHPVRPKRQSALLKLAFAPGEWAQVDWGAFGSGPVGPTSRRLSFFVMVLGYGRLMYVEFTVSQTMEHFHVHTVGNNLGLTWHERRLVRPKSCREMQLCTSIALGIRYATNSNTGVSIMRVGVRCSQTMCCKRSTVSGAKSRSPVSLHTRAGTCSMMSTFPCCSRT